MATSTYDKKRLAELVKEAKGERTIRQYATDTDISPSIISRILSEDYKPGAEMIKRLVKKSSKPRGNVTANDLMIAAGYLELDANKELISSIASIGGASIATIVALSLSMVSPLAGIPAGKLAGKAIYRAYSDLQDKKNKLDKPLDENKTDIAKEFAISEQLDEYEKIDKEFIKKSMKGIILAILDNEDLLVGKADLKSIQSYVTPDEVLNISNHNIESWWFKFYNCTDDSELIKLYTPKALVIALFGSFTTLPMDAKRKISFVVNSEAFYDEFVKLRGQNSYKGNISVILMDQNNANVVKEEFISYFDDNSSDNELIKLA